MDDTTATFEWAFRWLAAHRPAVPAATVLVHGDYRMGNLIVDGSDLAAVLDWELVHLGDAYEDLAWFCIRAWRFGAPASLGAGGLGSIESFLRAYEQAGATTVDRVAFHWWLVLATLRWGVICRYQAERHLSGQFRSVELAAIGRRVCETEWDLLDLLEEVRAVIGAYGRPLAAELVAAVAEFLETDVRAGDQRTGQLPRQGGRQRAAHRRARTARRERGGDPAPRWPAWVSPMRRSLPPRSGPASWTGAPTRSPPACAHWCDIGWPLPIPDTTARIGASAMPATSAETDRRRGRPPVHGDREGRCGGGRSDVERRHRGLAGRRPPRRRQGPRAAGHRLVHHRDHRASLRDSRPPALR